MHEDADPGWCLAGGLGEPLLGAPSQGLPPCLGADPGAGRRFSFLPGDASQGTAAAPETLL